MSLAPDETDLELAELLAASVKAARSSGRLRFADGRTTVVAELPAADGGEGS